MIGKIEFFSIYSFAGVTSLDDDNSTYLEAEELLHDEPTAKTPQGKFLFLPATPSIQSMTKHFACYRLLINHSLIIGNN